jgi:maltokinase
MLRSLDHVGRIADRRTSYALSARVESWIADARQSFLTSYRAELAASQMSHLFDATLLVPFEVEQECRELLYASRHLPRWTYVPDAALSALIPEPEPHPEPAAGDRR